jgi:hypothetical protein
MIRDLYYSCHDREKFTETNYTLGPIKNVLTLSNFELYVYTFKFKFR